MGSSINLEFGRENQIPKFITKIKVVIIKLEWHTREEEESEKYWTKTNPKRIFQLNQTEPAGYLKNNFFWSYGSVDGGL